MKNLKIFLFVILTASVVFLTRSFLLPSVKAQSSNSDASDAIAVRIIPNPNHYSISRWYESQGFSGAPQELTVDGYEAVRDGRTVYVNATNVEGKNIYTNVYLISYNQTTTNKTVDILGQIISHWKFNSNVGVVESNNTIANCAISNKNCSSNSDCSDSELCSGSGNSSSSCVLKVAKNCSIDADCPSNFFCNSLKSKIIRDAKRIGQLEELKESLFKYKEINKTFPILKSGTYLANHSISVWPSWSQNLLANLGASANFLDPINRLGACSGYDVKTCWDATLNKFVYAPNSNYLMLPAGSYAFVYQTDVNGSNYNLCATLESRDPSLDYHFSPNDPSGSACLIATGITTGGAAGNTAPILRDKFLDGEAGQEFNGFIRVADNENNPLTWTIYTNGTNWKNWQNNNVNNSGPVLKYSNITDQKKVYASVAGDPGDYVFSFKVDDGNGGVLSTSTIIRISNSAPLIEADDGTYVLSSENPFSYSFNFSDSNLGTPESSYSVTKISGPYDIWAESKTVTFTSIGVNKYKVTHSGVISAAHKLSQDTEFSYKIQVTDKYGASSTKNVTIKVAVRKMFLDFNCASKIRVGGNYSCVLGSAATNGRQNISYSAKSPLLNNLVIAKNASSIFSISGVVSEVGIINTEIVTNDEYGDSFSKPFFLQSYNYCGDGKKQVPNDEGQGGPRNNGYEDCDGTDGIASSAKTSNAFKQYACSTKPGEVTPDIITSNNYCAFPSPLSGGGYCGDGICSSASAGGPETPCNCGIDCGGGINCSGAPACTYTYSWGDCQPTNNQTATVLTALPAGCSGTPLTTKYCNYNPECTPNCSNKNCGSDGCGGSCGACLNGKACSSAGTCVSCINNIDCNDNNPCTDDSCSSGACTRVNVSGTASCTVNYGTCTATGSQTCSDGVYGNCSGGTDPRIANCSGKTCGSDGCGGTCGTCPNGKACSPAGTCVACSSNADCNDNNPCTNDSCSSGTCVNTNNSSQVKCSVSFGTCTATGSQTCSGGVYGDCTGATDPTKTNCNGKSCGPDGCGGTCGTCTDSKICSTAGICVCAPSCSGKNCGPDGCGGTCGACTGGTTCSSSGTCVGLSCAPGYYVNVAYNYCAECGTYTLYCPGGTATAPLDVPAGHYSTGGTPSTRTGESACPAGEWCTSGQLSGLGCQPGYYCPIGSSYETLYDNPCPDGTANPDWGGASVSDCKSCQAGYWSYCGTVCFNFPPGKAGYPKCSATSL